MVSETNCSGQYFSTSSDYAKFIDSRSFIVTSVLRSVLILLAAVSNILIIVSINRTPSLHTPSYLLVFSQPVSDLCVGLLVQPLYTAWQVAQFKRYFHISCLIFNVYICVCPLFTMVSCFTMTAISFDRFLAIYVHLRYRTFVTKKRTIVGIILIWVIAGVGCSSTIVSGKLDAFPIWNFVIVVFCLAISSLSFFASARLLHQRQIQTGTMNALAGGAFNFGKYKRSLVTMAYVYILFIFCYAPMLAHFIFIVFSVERNVSMLEVVVVVEVFYLNSTLNSFVYFWRNKSLRMTVKALIGLANYRHSKTV